MEGIGLTPAVYRNARYEAAIVRQQMQINALFEALDALRSALVFLHGQIDPEHQIPALPEIRDRAFGMGH